MRVQCDVCGAGAASVFCCADEAALCGACDRRVHRANKLAGKHRRLAFLSDQSPPLCDVCQERRGFLFCHEDRAILCRNCDVPIHTANKLTMAHNRYLLTGVRLDAALIPSSSEAEEEEEEEEAVVQNSSKNQSSEHKATAAEEETLCSSSTTTTMSTTCNSSSISDYLIKMLPGWHVEDFLTDDAATAAGDGSCQAGHGQVLGGVKEEQQFATWLSPAGEGGEFPREEAEAASRQPWGDESVMVPQIHYQWNSNKRSRASQWYL